MKRSASYGIELGLLSGCQKLLSALCSLGLTYYLWNVHVAILTILGYSIKEFTFANTQNHFYGQVWL